MAQKMVEDEETKKSGNTLFCWKNLICGIINIRQRRNLMHRKLIKQFIKDAKNIEDNAVRSQYGYFSAIVNIISNVLLFVVKLILGLSISSISILADAINNLNDSISSIITFVGFKLASLPPDKEHPFGHARYEGISGLLVSIIVVFVGFEFIQASFKEIFSPSLVKANKYVLVILIITLLIKLWQYSFNNFVGKKIKSNAILALAIDSRNDMLTTLLVLFGLLVEVVFNLKVDGYIGFLLAIIIIFSGISGIRETIGELLGKRPDDEMLLEIKNQLKVAKDIIGYHDLVVHQYGHNQYFATVHIEVDANLSLVDAHEIIDKIENDFKKNLDINLVVHLDPVILDDPIVTHYWQSVKEIIKNCDDLKSFHDFRVVKKLSYNIIIFDLVIKESETRSDEEIISRVSKLILEKFKNDKVKITIDRNYISLGKIK